MNPNTPLPTHEPLRIRPSLRSDFDFVDSLLVRQAKNDSNPLSGTAIEIRRRRFDPRRFRLALREDQPVAVLQLSDGPPGVLRLTRIVCPKAASSSPWSEGLELSVVEALRRDLDRDQTALICEIPPDHPLRRAYEALGFAAAEMRSTGLQMTDRTPSDRRWMERAFERARQGAAADEAPIGAVIVRGEEVLAEAGNACVARRDPTAHAEILAIREAARRLGRDRLDGCELHVTVEPCLMCAGALIHARIERLVYGAANEKFGAVQSVAAVLENPQWNHRIAIRPAFREREAAQLMQDFFRRKR